MKTANAIIETENIEKMPGCLENLINTYLYDHQIKASDTEMIDRHKIILKDQINNMIEKHSYPLHCGTGHNHIWIADKAWDNERVAIIR